MSSLPESSHRLLSSMPVVSGVTESHKLEQEQLQTPKQPQSLQSRSQKTKKAHIKYSLIPSQPVVMPRTAHMVADIEEQLIGLEFGSGPISPGKSKISEKSPLPLTLRFDFFLFQNFIDVQMFYYSHFISAHDNII